MSNRIPCALLITSIAGSLFAAPPRTARPQPPGAGRTVRLPDWVSRHARPDLSRLIRDAGSQAGPAGLDLGLLLDTLPVVGRAIGDQSSVSTAFDGADQFLVVYASSGAAQEVQAVRMDTAGRLLDTTAIAFATGTVSTHERTAAVFDGTNYLVVWTDMRSGSSSDIYAARISRSGVLLDSSGIAVSTADMDQTSVAAACLDGTSLVVWDDTREGRTPEVYGARVSSSGEVLDPFGINLTRSEDFQLRPAVTAGDSTYLVVWEDARHPGFSEIWGTRVRPDGAVLDSAGFRISIDSSLAEAATLGFDGDRFLVAWNDWNVGICAARVTRTGFILDPCGIPLSPAGQYATTAHDGANWLVAWMDQSGIAGARISSGGVLLDSSPQSLTPPADYGTQPDLVFGATDYLLSWCDNRLDSTTCELDAFAARVTPDCAVRDSNGILLSLGTNFQQMPAAAFDGANYLVCWTDSRGDVDVCGALVSPAGNVVGPGVFPICTATSQQAYLAVAFDGSNYLVTWADGRAGLDDWDIYAARVTPAGTVLDPDGIPVATAAEMQLYPDVAPGAACWLITWTSLDLVGGRIEVYCARVASDGTVLDPDGFRIGRDTMPRAYSGVDFDGTNFLVCWSDGRNGEYADIYGARVNGNALILDPDGIPVSQSPGSQYVPGVCFDGLNYFVLWYDDRSDTASDICACRVTPAGAVLDPDGIYVGTPFIPVGLRRALADDGMGIVAAWTDLRDTTNLRVAGARLDPAGNVFDTFLLAHPNSLLPALAHGPGRQTALFYTGWTGTVRGRNYSAYRIWGELGPLGALAEQRVVPPLRLALRVSPNPCRGRTSISYSLPHSGSVSLKLYDVSGRLVRTLAEEGHRPAGRSALNLRLGVRETMGQSTTGQSLIPRGVYVLKLETRNSQLGTSAATAKLLVE